MKGEVVMEEGGGWGKGERVMEEGGGWGEGGCDGGRWEEKGVMR